MNENTFTNTKFLIRSILVFARKTPPEQYIKAKFDGWVARYGAAVTEIRKTHVTFVYADVAALITEYFQFGLANRKA